MEIERRRRIKVAVWAYAYEVLDASLVSDHLFDAECSLVDLSVATGDRRLDTWFRKEFQACTGQWVHKHPDLKRLDQLARQLIAGQSKDNP